MVACFEVFQTWEDEYEKLQVLLRDIVKRKREENLKMVWRLSPAHRKLQSRLDHMRRFRRQHEQLRAVIVRVLRPQVRISYLCALKKKSYRNKGRCLLQLCDVAHYTLHWMTLLQQPVTLVSNVAQSEQSSIPFGHSPKNSVDGHP